MRTLREFEPCALRGGYVFVEPLSEANADELYEIGREETIWTFLPRGPMVSREDALAYIRDAIGRQVFGGQLAYAIRLVSSGTLIGCTRYIDIQPNNRSLEIGWTLIHPSQWKTRAATESEFLLVRQAFEVMDAARVYFLTDARNTRARRLMEKHGITYEGTLRRHRQTKDGSRRDSMVFSIIEEEWPSVKQRVEGLLAAPEA
jgi:RimJ/RimL family protein N-acetyltransferase